mgnify:FL=1
MEEAMEYIEDKFTLSSGLCSHIISDILCFLKKSSGSRMYKITLLNNLLNSLGLTIEEEKQIIDWLV